MAAASNILRDPTERESDAGERLEPNPASDRRDDKHSHGRSLTSSHMEDANTEVKLESVDHGMSKSEPIHTEVVEVLRKITSQWSHRQTQSSLRGGFLEDASLEKRDTLAGLELSDPVLDPNSATFDLHKYLRKALDILQQENIKLSRAGVVLKDVNVRGSGSSLNLQSTVGSLLALPFRLRQVFKARHNASKHILRDFQGLLKSGELLIVLGRPGSGCSTFLKTITGVMHGLDLDQDSIIHYCGIPQKQMIYEFKGEVIYNQEVDHHFPHLTVGETLEHAAALRTPSRRAMGISRTERVKHVTQVVMAAFGLSHTYNTKVGNDFIRGVSGGERKRVSIAEMALAGAPIAAWDNSTRGLDSATALAFTKALRLAANLRGSAHAVAIYQASQAIYDLFDRATVLYEGRQIYFGPASHAKSYFEDMGWFCPPRQTTGDFLTSVTNPTERQLRAGYRDIPRTPDEFEAYWRRSPQFAELQSDIAAYEQEYPLGDTRELEELRTSKRDQQAKHTRRKSPFVLSIPMQIKLNTTRAFHRAWNDKASTFTPVVSNVIIALIIGSVFFDTPNATAGFNSKGAVLFFAVLINALSAISEINRLYSQRPIIEKHKSYAFYHPWTEAMAGIVLDSPIKFISAAASNLILYFMAGLRREPSQFFIFFLVNFVSMFVMTAVFRSLAALTKTVSQAMALAGVLVLAIVVYTGFSIPVPYMHPWFSWIRFINPIFYAFEILVANEFHARRFACSQFVPAHPSFQGNSFICLSRGAVAGEETVSGDAFIANAYQYYYSNVWRNFGILLAFLVAFFIAYFAATELNSSTTSTADVLVFRRGCVPQNMKDSDNEPAKNEETRISRPRSTASPDGDGDLKAMPPQSDVFTWRDIVYDIEIKGQPRRLLDHVSGWVKPGTLTALMGTSGAGKTTLLDALAQRTTTGVITGDMFVNGKALDGSFQRSTGYVQQQDVHLETATVRESLRFSAMLRQPRTVSRAEKYDYVESVIKMLGMEDFADAVVGTPGQGLNVEQRKLLTIGVEVAAKPTLLLFLDEPTSGLDSQSAWAICVILRRLADHGQAILCTIHQPSAILFQQFDRLLFLRRGGQTVYFGDIGDNSGTLLNYFERNGGRKCGADENPAEYMLEMATDKDRDWHEAWKGSTNAQDVQHEIARFYQHHASASSANDELSTHSEFALPLAPQLYEVASRTFQQYWRTPSYILAKFVLSAASGLFIGFSFYNADNSEQGMQNVLYSLFQVCSIFSTIVQQIMPLFVTQRSLYEVRERPSRVYSWKVFICANIIVEWPYQIIAGVLVFATFYYPVVGIQDSERQALALVLCIAFFIYASTFAQLCIAALPDAQTAGSIVTLLFVMTLIFNGVMQPPSALPGFWIFMYRVSPLTYWVGGMANAMLHGRPISCSRTETSVFDPPSNGQTCGAYLAPFLTQAPGTLQNPMALSDCRYCGIRNADQFLASVNIQWSDRWRDFGLMWVYIAFNVAGTALLYWFFRVRKPSTTKSVPFWRKLDPIKEGIRNSYKSEARVNKRNVKVF